MTVEFKESLSSSFARELVEMANTIGGKLLLGVREEARAGTYPEPQLAETGFLTVTFFPKPEVRAQVEAQSTRYDALNEVHDQAHGDHDRDRVKATDGPGTRAAERTRASARPRVSVTYGKLQESSFKTPFKGSH